MMNQRGAETYEKILKAGVKLWRKDAKLVTARGIAREIGMTHATVLFHFKDSLRDDVAQYAVKKGDSKVIVQLLATNHSAIWNMSKKERQKHMTKALGR